MTRSHASQGYSLRDLQSLLGVSRRVLAALIDAGFVAPARGRRNELRFSFQDVVLLRTAFKLQAARIPSRRILQALKRIKAETPSAPLTAVRISAVGDAVTVRSGPSQWDASSGQMLLDFGDAQTPGDIAFMDSAPANRKAREKEADEWYALAEQLQDTDPVGAERAYRKALETSPDPHFHAYNNLGALLSRDDARCADALEVFEEALKHFQDIELLHFNRAIQLEQLDRLEEAAEGYLQCVRLNPRSDDALFSLAGLLEHLERVDEAAKVYIQCLQINPDRAEAYEQLDRLMSKLKWDKKAIIRNLSALRRTHG